MHKIKTNLNNLVDVKIAAAMTIIFVLFCWSAYSVYILNQSSIYSENGTLENIQVFVHI